jgi:histidine triad (HIT) family protein
MAACIFCDIASGKRPSRQVYADETVYAFHDISPQAPVHVLIIPRRHVEGVNDVGEGDEALMGHLVGVARKVARELGVAEDGYRLVINTNAAACQSVFHLHAHLLGGRSMGWPPG